MERPTSPADVLAIYQAARTRYADEAAAATARGERVGGIRLLVFTAMTAIGIAAWVGAVSMWWIAIPLVAFIGLVTHSARIDQQRLNAERATAWYDDGIARMAPDWAAKSPDDRSSPVDATHPYADDIDLFGGASLFARVDRTRTGAGAAVLVDLLAEPPKDVPTVNARREAVDELSPAVSFRERLAGVATEAHRGTRSEDLRSWSERPVTHPAWWHRVLWILTAIASTITVVGWLMGLVPILAMIIALLVHVIVLRPHRTWMQGTLTQAQKANPELGMLRRLIDEVASQDFQAQELRSAQADLAGDPSASLQSAQRMCAFVESLANPFFLPIALLLNVPAHLSAKLEAWREAHGASCVTWSQAVARVEAFASVAGYDFEVPHHGVAALQAGPAIFRAEALSHPLLSAGVANDVHLGEGAPAGWIISGSNMSGKSTLLRSIGSSVVLAYAGARVPASSMTLSILRLGASIHIRDALKDGVSRFQAELIRLRRIYDLSAEGTCLFLLDEVLAGTNSHDRRIGASAVVRALLDRGALGLVTTHDLALTKLGDDPRLRNVHFSDHFEGESLVFDYTLRDGVVKHSNALALMRLIGLPVGSQPSGETAAQTTDQSDDRSSS